MTFLTPSRVQGGINGQAVIQLVEDTYGYPHGTLKRNTKASHIAHPRHLAAFLLVELGMSTPGAGKAMGGKHHTTVLNSCRIVRQAMKADKSVMELVKDLKGAIAAEPERFTKPKSRVLSTLKPQSKPGFILPNRASMKIPEMRELDELILAGKGDEPRMPVEALAKRAGVN